MEETVSFEAGLKRLEAIDQELKREDISLEDAVKLYEEAKKLSQVLHKSLDQAELKVKDLQGQDLKVELDEE